MHKFRHSETFSTSTARGLWTKQVPHLARLQQQVLCKVQGALRRVHGVSGLQRAGEALLRGRGQDAAADCGVWEKVVG